jgi:hypothetical protein
LRRGWVDAAGVGAVWQQFGVAAEAVAGAFDANIVSLVVPNRLPEASATSPLFGPLDVAVNVWSVVSVLYSGLLRSNTVPSTELPKARVVVPKRFSAASATIVYRDFVSPEKL